MRSKLKPKILIPVLLLVALAGVYKFALGGPKAEAKPKVHGQVYVLPKEFLVNLAEDRFAKVSVALVIDSHEPIGGDHGHGAPTPPEGFGPLPQEAVVRDIITDSLTDLRADDLIHRETRERVKRRLARKVRSHTDVKVGEVLLTDVAVQ